MRIMAIGPQGKVPWYLLHSLSKESGLFSKESHYRFGRGVISFSVWIMWKIPVSDRTHLPPFSCSPNWQAGLQRLQCQGSCLPPALVSGMTCRSKGRGAGCEETYFPGSLFCRVILGCCSPHKNFTTRFGLWILKSLSSPLVGSKGGNSLAWVLSTCPLLSPFSTFFSSYPEMRYSVTCWDLCQTCSVQS